MEEEGEQIVEDPEGNEVVGSDERLWAFLAHLGGLATSFVIPLVVLLAKRDDSRFVGEQAREALNFQITILIAIVISAALFCVTVFLAPVIVLFDLIFSIVACIKAYDGQPYRYPWSLRLVK